MSALLYVMKRGFINKFKKALKRPVTYFYIIGGGIYAVFVVGLFGKLLSGSSFATPHGLVAFTTAWTFYMFAMNFSGYARKKGVLFHPSHAHFIFTAPISPKLVLLMGALKNFVFSFFGAIFLSIVGIFGFHITVVQAVLFFLFSFVLEVILEGSQMIFSYTNEKFSEKTLNILSKSIYALLLAIVLFLVLYFRKGGFDLGSVAALVDHPTIQMFPIVGWNIAAFRLILLGPDTLNIVCTILYIGTVAVFFFLAKTMKCTGNYYEEAAKFADDYAEARSKSKNGEAAFSTGKRKKFRHAAATYKGKGAKAIFYRQLLEYKKERFFIFGYMTLFNLAGAAIIIFAIGKPKNLTPELFLLAAVAYLVVITSGYMGKWEKELKNPYLYLIPDTPIRKLWYATLMEHLKALIDGSILAVPISIAWHISFVKMMMVILIYVMLQANKMYIRVLVEALLGDVLGQIGKSILRPVIQMGILGVGIMIAAVAGALVNMDLVFPILLIYSMILTVVIAFIAASRFAQMEQFN